MGLNVLWDLGLYEGVVAEVSFDAFFRAEFPVVVRSLTLALGDRSLAEDCAQVGFERAYARWGHVSRHARPGTWVYVVAVRHGRRQAKRRRPGPEPARADIDEAAGVVGEVRFVELLGSLPQRQREAVVLRHLADLRVHDIAQAQGVTAGTVKASLHAAYARLRVELASIEEVQR